MPGLVGTAVRYVSIPAFSRLAEGEKAEFAVGVQRSLPLMIGVVAPIATVMVVLSPAMIHVLYGEQWAPAAEALRFLAFVMVARMFTALVFDVQTGLGNTRVTVWLNLAWLVALLPALWLGAHAGGMRGAAVAHAVVAVVVAIPLAGWLLHRSGVDMRPVIRRCARPVFAAVVAGVVMALVARPLDTPFVQLVVAGGLGTVVYMLIALPAEGWAKARRLDDVLSGGASGHDMSGTSPSTLVSIALPVYNGGRGLGGVIESVLAQSHSGWSWSSATTRRPTRPRRSAGTTRAATDVWSTSGRPRTSVCSTTSSARRNAPAVTYVRWIGDDDSLEPEYVERTLEAFAEDERRVVVTTQIVYAGTPVTHRLRPDGDGVVGPGRAVRRACCGC